MRAVIRPASPLSLFCWAVVALAATASQAADLVVINSSGFSAVYKQLVPAFEARTGDKLQTQAGSSFGTAPTSIPSRLDRGERADVVIMIREGLDAVQAKGQILEGSAVDLVRARIAMAVKAGAPVPDIGSEEGLRRALLAAQSVAYSDSASGTYIATELYKRLGIAEPMAGKSRPISGEPVGQVVARGEAEIGFQQMSELLPVAGITVVGFIPESVQKVTIFSAGVVAASKEPAEARALIRYLASPEAYDAIRAGGLDPADPSPGK